MFPSPKSTLRLSMDITGTVVSIYGRSSPENDEEVLVSTINLASYADEQTTQNVVGQVVLQSLRTLSGLPGATNNDDDILAVIRPAAEAGDARAQRIMGSFCERKALDARDAKLLDDAESWYQRAVGLGDQDARHYLSKVWPRHRLTLQKMIDNAPPSDDEAA